MLNTEVEENDENSAETATKDNTAGMSQHRISLDYLPFHDIEATVEQEQKERRRVTKRIFLPLYVTTFLLLFLPVLPSFLVILLGTVWGVLFLVTPVYFLYYYDPMSDMPCVS